jgi:hypothetical protein
LPVAWLLTFLVQLVALTWFHAASVAAGADILAGMTGAHGIMTPAQIAGGRVELAVSYAWIVVLLAIAVVPPNALEMLRAWEPAITMPAAVPVGSLVLWRGSRERLSFSLTPSWALAAGALLAVGVLGVNRVSEFLYWQF